MWQLLTAFSLMMPTASPEKKIIMRSPTFFVYLHPETKIQEKQN